MDWQQGLKGYLEIELYGENPERVINMAMKRGLCLWDIRTNGTGRFFLKIRVGGLRDLRHLVRKSSCRIRIVRKRGAVFFLMKLQKRKVFAAGVLFFCLALYFLGSFVWFVEISGNESVETARIKEIAETCGLKPGVLKSGLDQKAIVAALMLEIPELAWAGIRIEGTKAFVEIAEKTLAGDEENRPADIVARSGGRIEEVLILTGTPLVKEGDIVEKGQLLVAAYENGSVSPGGTPEPVKARALVRARVRRVQIGECLLREERDVDSGQTITVTGLNICGREVLISGPKSVPYERHRVVNHVKNLSRGRIPGWSVELFTRVYFEQKHEVSDWGLDGAYEEALSRAKLRLRDLPADHRVTAQEHAPLASEKPDLIKVRYELETIEDIALYRFIAEEAEIRYN